MQYRYVAFVLCFFSFLWGCMASNAESSAATQELGVGAKVDPVSSTESEAAAPDACLMAGVPVLPGNAMLELEERPEQCAITPLQLSSKTASSKTVQTSRMFMKDDADSFRGLMFRVVDENLGTYGGAVFVYHFLDGNNPTTLMYRQNGVPLDLMEDDEVADSVFNAVTALVQQPEYQDFLSSP